MKPIVKSGFGRIGRFFFSSFEIFGKTIIIGNKFPFVGMPKSFNIPF